MASTIEEMMRALAAALDTIDGLNVSAFTPGQVTVPAAVVAVPAIPRYHATMGRGRIDLTFQVTVLVSAALDEVGQLLLAQYANPTGATSVVTAVETDKTLGGVVEDAYVVDFRPLGLDEVGVIGYFGGTFTVEVIARGV